MEAYRRQFDQSLRRGDWSYPAALKKHSLLNNSDSRDEAISAIAASVATLQLTLQSINLLCDPTNLQDHKALAELLSIYNGDIHSIKCDAEQIMKSQGSRATLDLVRQALRPQPKTNRDVPPKSDTTKPKPSVKNDARRKDNSRRKAIRSSHARNERKKCSYGGGSITGGLQVSEGKNVCSSGRSSRKANNKNKNGRMETGQNASYCNTAASSGSASPLTGSLAYYYDPSKPSTTDPTTDPLWSSLNYDVSTDGSISVGSVELSVMLHRLCLD